MRQRYRDTPFEAIEYDSSAKTRSRYIARNVGAKFDPPTLYLFYEDLEAGKFRRKKMPVRELDKKSQHTRLGLGSKKMDEIAKDLVTKHEILSCLPFQRVSLLNQLEIFEFVGSLKILLQIVDMLVKIRKHWHTSEASSSDLPPLPSKEALISIESLESPLSIGSRPTVVDKDLHDSFPETRSRRDNHAGHNDAHLQKDSPAQENRREFNGSTDLNKLGDVELSAIKSEMDKDFVRNRVAPGDAGFQYDVQKTFETCEGSHEWDAASDESAAGPLRKTHAQMLHTRLGDLETDADDDDDDDNDAASAADGGGGGGASTGDNESARVASTAFWWMRADAAHADAQRFDTRQPDSRPDARPDALREPAKEDNPLPSLVASSALGATLAAIQKSRALLADAPPTQSNEQAPPPPPPPQPSASVSLSKLGPLPSLAKPAPSALPKISPASGVARSSTAPHDAGQATVLDINEEIDFGFADYDADLDADAEQQPDFLDLIMPNRRASLDPLLPLANSTPATLRAAQAEPTLDEVLISGEPPGPSQVLHKNPVITSIRPAKVETDSPPPVQPQIAVAHPKIVKVDESSPKLAASVFVSKPEADVLSSSTMEAQTEKMHRDTKSPNSQTPVSEDLDAFLDDFEDFDSKSASTHPGPPMDKPLTKERVGFKDPSEKPNLSKPNSQSDLIESKPVNHTIENADSSATHSNSNDGKKTTLLLGQLPSLLPVATKPSSLFPLPSPSTLSSLDKHDSNKPKFKPLDVKDPGSNDSIPEDFDFEFEGSVSELLEDTNEAGRVKDDTASERNGVAEKGDGPYHDIPKNEGKESILEKFAEGVKKILSDTGTSAHGSIANKNSASGIGYDDLDNFGAGDTDSDSEVGSKGSELRGDFADRKINASNSKSVAFLEDESEIDGLFNDDEVSLEVDGEEDYLEENDAF